MASRHRDPIRLPLDLDHDHRLGFTVEFCGPYALVYDPPHITPIGGVR